MCRFLWLKNSLGHKVPARMCRLLRQHMRLTCQMCLTSVSDETNDLDSETLITDQTTLRNCQISSLNFTQKRCQPQETQIDYCCGKRVSILWILGWNSIGTKRTEYSDVILGTRFQPSFTHFGSVISDRSNFLISDQLEKKEVVLQSRQVFQGVLHPCLLQFLLVTVPSFYHRYSK